MVPVREAHGWHVVALMGHVHVRQLVGWQPRHVRGSDSAQSLDVVVVWGLVVARLPEPVVDAGGAELDALDGVSGQRANRHPAALQARLGRASPAMGATE